MDIAEAPPVADEALPAAEQARGFPGRAPVGWSIRDREPADLTVCLPEDKKRPSGPFGCKAYRVTILYEEQIHSRRITPKATPWSPV